ncbi:hypothetical protein ACS0TY_018333 [Phlomoides rotata]
MEQLPPKAPMSVGMAQAWPSFPWADEFLDFSSTRRSAHRRTVSDPIAFVEEPHSSNIGFERLDDEQLRNMFSDEVVALGSSSNPSSLNPSTPSDQNASEEDDDKITAPPLMPKTEPGPDFHTSTYPQDLSENDTIVDPKRIKRSENHHS